jgi:hypothetical protein
MARKLGELLIDGGILEPRQLEEALRTQRIFGGSLGSTLLQLGFVDEITLGKVLGRIYSLPAVARRDLLAASPDVVGLLPKDFARRHRALPFRLEGHRLHLALQNPADTLAVHEAAFLTGYQVVAHVTPEAVLRDALAYHHSSDPGPSRKPQPNSAPAPQAASRERPTTARPDAPRPGLPDDPTASDIAEALRTGPVVVGQRAQRRDDAAARARAAKPAATTGPVSTAGRTTAPSPSSPDSPLADFGRALAAARHREEVLTLVLKELAQHAPRALLFVVRKDSAVLWRAKGATPPPSPRVAVPLGESSVLDPVRETTPFSYGPVAMTNANRDFYTLLGGSQPKVALVLPVFVKKKPVLVLYGDDPTGTAAPPDFRRLRALASLSSWALEALVLRTKILRESGALGGNGS